MPQFTLIVCIFVAQICTSSSGTKELKIVGYDFFIVLLQFIIFLEASQMIFFELF